MLERVGGSRRSIFLVLAQFLSLAPPSISGALKASYTDELTAIINGRRRVRENASLGCVPRNLPPSTIAAGHPLNDQGRASRNYRPCTHARDGDRSGWSIDR